MMNVGTLAALGSMLSGDGDEREESMMGATDLQFKAFIKMALVLAETTREVKEFQKTWGSWGSWVGATGHFPAYVWMIPKIADATGDMEKVKQVLQDILKMSDTGS